MSTTAVVNFTPLELMVPVGSLTYAASLPLSDGSPRGIREGWEWGHGAEHNPFGSPPEPKVVFAPSAELGLDGILVREQLALFSGNDCDVWNGVLWPALIAMPEIARKQFMPVSALSSLERHLLAAATGLIAEPDVLILSLTPGVLTLNEHHVLKDRLAKLAEAAQVAIIQVGRITN